jgi:hypothetical protein
VTDRAGRQPSPAIRRAHLTVLALALLVHALVLIFPTRHFLGRFGWGLFYPFRFHPDFSLPTAILVFATTLLCIIFLTRRVGGSRWSGRGTVPRLGLLLLLGIFVKVGLIHTTGDGLSNYRIRTLTAGHSEFLLEAVQIDDLGATVLDYESFVRDRTAKDRRIYLKQKGPGVIVLFSLLDRAANGTVGRSVLRRWAEDEAFLGKMSVTLDHRRPRERYDLTESRKKELAYLVTLVALVFPVLTATPLIPLYLLAGALMGARAGLLVCLSCLLVPGTTLMVGHLDYAVFPALFCAVVASFVLGHRRRRSRWIVLSALLFVLYSTMTLAATVAVLFVAVFVALELVRTGIAGRLGRGELHGSLGRLGLFLVSAALLLLVLRLAMNFDPWTRYTYAREIQVNWIAGGDRPYWLVTNAAEYLLAFSFCFALLAAVQSLLSIRKMTAGTGKDLDSVVLSWSVVLIGLALGGGQHGETGRLWAFMNAIGCLGAGRLVAVLFRRRPWIPLGGFLSILILSRFCLAYF